MRTRPRTKAEDAKLGIREHNPDNPLGMRDSRTPRWLSRSRDQKLRRIRWQLGRLLGDINRLAHDAQDARLARLDLEPDAARKADQLSRRLMRHGLEARREIWEVLDKLQPLIPDGYDPDCPDCPDFTAEYGHGCPKHDPQDPPEEPAS